MQFNYKPDTKNFKKEKQPQISMKKTAATYM